MKLDVSDCAFCSIVRGEVDSATIFEDDATLAFLNLRQSNEGHVLVVPKRHFEQIYDLDEEIASSLAKTVRRVARAVRRVYEAGKDVDLAVEWCGCISGSAARSLARTSAVLERRLLVVYPAGVAGRARSRSVQFLKSISGPLVATLKDDAV